MGQAARKFEVLEGGCSIPALTPIEQPIEQPLNNHEMWLSVVALADLAKVSPQAAQKALSARRWRGFDLAVREVQIGRGGAGGMAPQVHVNSLPEDLRVAWYGARGIELHRRVDPATGEVRMVAERANDPRFEGRMAVARWRLDIIRAAADAPRGSAARRALVEVAAAQMVRGPDGKMRQISRASLYDWLGAYDTDGLIGLCPDVRKDAGTKRMLVSTVWDAYFAGRISAGDHQGVADALIGHIRSLWASGEAGWRAVCEKSTTRLIEISRDLRDVAFDGLPLGRLGDRGQSQFGICDVNRRMAEAQRDYRLIAMRDKDNARFQDTVAPTIRRDFNLLKPRDIVVGDVHPMDIMVMRPDGSKAYPKAISWFDPATGEVHMTVVLLEPREGVRREHVAMAFEAMVAEWGLPKLLYLDNGQEYSWGDMISGFTQLSKLAGMVVKENSLVDDRVVASREAVVRSLAYNAKGKPGIEGLFGNLERVFFSNVPGWTAGERMRKKTHAKGRDPIPFPGDMDAFYETIRTHLDHYHKRPQYGRLAGKSPNEALRLHIENGWGKVILERPEVLALAFSTEETRVVDRGTVAFTPRHGSSQRYYCEALLGLMQGTPITIRVPAYDPRFVFCFDAASGLIGIAHPEERYHPLDPAGAIEGASRSKYLRRHIREMSRHVALMDLTDETARHLGYLPEAPEMPVVAVVDAGMLDRMAQISAEERARLAAPDTPSRRAPTQWKTAPNAALAAVQFEEEDQ